MSTVYDDGISREDINEQLCFLAFRFLVPISFGWKNQTANTLNSHLLICLPTSYLPEFLEKSWRPVDKLRWFFQGLFSMGGGQTATNTTNMYSINQQGQF